MLSPKHHKNEKFHFFQLVHPLTWISENVQKMVESSSKISWAYLHDLFVLIRSIFIRLYANVWDLRPFSCDHCNLNARLIQIALVWLIKVEDIRYIRYKGNECQWSSLRDLSCLLKKVVGNPTCPQQGFEKLEPTVNSRVSWCKQQ